MYVFVYITDMSIYPQWITAIPVNVRSAHV